MQERKLLHFYVVSQPFFVDICEYGLTDAHSVHIPVSYTHLDVYKRQPVIVANNDFLEEKPDTAKAFLSAVKKGYEDAIADPKEAADILCEAAPELDKELVLASQEWLADQYKAEVCLLYTSRCV